MENFIKGSELKDKTKRKSRVWGGGWTPGHFYQENV